MVENFISDFIKWTLGFWIWPDLSTNEGKKKGNKLLLLRSFFIIGLSIIAPIILVGTYFCISANLDKNSLDTIIISIPFLSGGISYTLSELLWFCFFLFLTTCLLSLLYALGIKNNWKMESKEELVGIHEIKRLFNERYFLDNKRCEECEKYAHSMKLMEKEFEKMPHKEFVDFFREATNSETHNPQLLNIIIKDFKDQIQYAKLLCLLSNPQYYARDEANSQLRSLTDYFIGFSPLIDDDKRVKRVFTLSAIGDPEKTEEYKYKAKCLFQYLLTNYVTRVETCLLVDDKDMKLHIDYVVGKYPGEMTKLYSKRISYLSYENPDEKDKDYMVRTTDQLFTNILEADFYDRWKGRKSNNRTRTRVEVSDDNPNCWKEIMEYLSVRNDQGSDVILTASDLDEIFTNVAIGIKCCTYEIPGKKKDELLNKLKEVAKKEQYNVEISRIKSISKLNKKNCDIKLSTNID